jgi:hypothetical protein
MQPDSESLCPFALAAAEPAPTIAELLTFQPSSESEKHPMKLNIRLAKTFLLACTLVALSVLPRLVQAEDSDYSFKVHNTTDSTIVKLLCSEDGEKYGEFNIGDGIKAGDTESLTWDKSTNSQSCHQWFKAEFENGKESKPVKFDFCEKGLELAF